MRTELEELKAKLEASRDRPGLAARVEALEARIAEIEAEEAANGG